MKRSRGVVLIISFGDTWFSGSHKFKENKQTTFLHRWTSLACDVVPSVTTFSTDFSF
jgi:hypothetical protein